jgi:hypothetical protein
MARRKPYPTLPDKDQSGTSDKRGGYTGGVPARAVPPPSKLPSAYQPVSGKSYDR